MRKVPRLTELRAARLSRGLTLDSVAKAAGVSRTRASIIERDPSIARSGETSRLLSAIERLAAEPPLSERRQLAVTICAKLGVLLCDVLHDGEVTLDQLAEITGIEPAAILSTIETATLMSVPRATADGKNS